MLTAEGSSRERVSLQSDFGDVPAFISGTGILPTGRTFTTTDADAHTGGQREFLGSTCGVKYHGWFEFEAESFEGILLIAVGKNSVEEMISRCEARMRQLARRMRRQFLIVRRWDDTDDILQESSVRLHCALQTVVPESELHLSRLACLQVRRVLLDLSRKYASCQSFAANHDTGHGDRLDRLIPDQQEAGERDVIGLEGWARFHQAAEALPQTLRDVFDLLWYAEFDQGTAARILGVTQRTLQRRWRQTRRLLVEKLADEIPR